MNKLDYKKEFKELYAPKSVPSIVDVPTMVFIQVDGRGNPNEQDGEYKAALEVLYALSYSIKMSLKSGSTPTGYFDYVVPPLEGLWWLDDGSEIDYGDKSKFCWTAMIRQPEFVTNKAFGAAIESVKQKKPQLDTSKARLVTCTEGLCVQCMHIGSFDEEPATLRRMMEFMEENKLISDLSDSRRHHELYLSDPRKGDASKMKTILRYPVRGEA